MKKSIVLILAVIFVFPIIARSQNDGVKGSSPSQVTRNDAMHQRSTQEMALLKEAEKSGGGPGSDLIFQPTGIYLAPGWMPGYVVLNDKSIIENINLRYDIYHQQMQYIRESDTLAFSQPEELDHIFLGNRKFIYAEYEAENVIRKSYLEVIHEGKCGLFAHWAIQYHLNPESMPRLENDVYVGDCQYYLRKEGQVATPIKACRKSILLAFSDKEEAVKKFMDDNDINGKNCEQLKLVISFYNSLQ